MTITLPLDRVADFVGEHPWPTVALVFLLGVILPAVWSARRHTAAMAVIYALLDTSAAIVFALRGRPRVIGSASTVDENDNR